MINLKTYIVHCKKFNERKLFLQDQIANLFSNYEFYEEYDGDELTESIIQSYYCSSVEEQIKKLKLWYEQKQGTPYARILNKAEISLTIKHYEVLKKIAESSDEYDLKQSSHLNISVFEAPEFDFVGDLGMKRRATHLEIA
jgi:hypothetical protein